MFLKTRLLEIKLDPANFEVPRGKENGLNLRAFELTRYKSVARYSKGNGYCFELAGTSNYHCSNYWCQMYSFKF